MVLINRMGRISKDSVYLGEDDRWTRRDTLNAAAVAAISLVFAVLRWKKLESLLWLDPARWLNEFSRAARGEVPYRDFAFLYPPFTFYLYSWTMRGFGVSFTVVQTITDVIDAGVIACGYALIRRLFPRSLHVAVAGALVAVCSTSLMNFNFFSFVTYHPALQTGAAGVMLLLLGLLGYVRNGAMGRAAWALAAGGGFIAVSSKPEAALAALVLVALAGLMARQPGLSLKIAAAAILPGTLMYLSAGWAAGMANLLAGVGGYGLATEFCPWWPTGVGVFGMLAYCGAAVAIGAVLTLPKGNTFRAALAGRYGFLLAAGICGAGIYCGYIFYQSHDALTEPGLALAERVRRTLPYVVYTSPVLEPALWVTIAVFLTLAWRVLVRGAAGPADRELLLIVASPVVMGTRALFGTTLGIYPEVAAICYPFLLILGPYFVWRFLEPAGPQYAAAIVMALTVGYGLVRVAGGWPELLSDQRYGTLSTAAGVVHVRDFDRDSGVYAYVLQHTAPDDYVLDLPYGGGINFASGRRDPIFDMQLQALGIPAIYEQKDLELIEQRPPKIVIGLDEANLGTFWGYGLKGNHACPCPRLVWEPDRPSWDPAHVYPVARYIQEHYRVERRIADRVVWVAK
jgi:hypothetical protein